MSDTLRRDIEADVVLRMVDKVNMRAAEMDKHATTFDAQYYMAMAAELRQIATEFEAEWRRGVFDAGLPRSAQLTVDCAPPDELLGPLG
jgi:hypothetical protein